MTLIAAFKIESIPLLVGDFLVTDNAISKKHFFLPTKPDLINRKPNEMGARIQGIRKKIQIINNGFCVGFTGNLSDGTKILKKLVEEFSDFPPTLSQLGVILGRYNNRTNGAATIIGWTVVSRPVCFEWSSTDSNDPIMVSSSFSGSGGIPFRTSLSNVWAQDIAPSISTAVEKAQFIGVNKIGSVLVQELSDGKNLEQFYGFGAELIFWNGGSFEYVPKITYLFWNAGFSKSGNFRMLPADVIATYQNFNEFSAMQISHMEFSEVDEALYKAKSVFMLAATPLSGYKVGFDKLKKLGLCPQYQNSVFMHLRLLMKFQAIVH